MLSTLKPTELHGKMTLLSETSRISLHQVLTFISPTLNR